MRKLLSSIIILLASCITCPQVYSGSTTAQTVQLKKKHNQSNNQKGSRIPGIVVCKISTEGIQMGVEPDGILSYEIWDTYGENCVASYTEESDFINALFSMEGEYQIHFSTEEYSYIGYVTI